MNHLGENIARLRREQGMTQDALAERLGISAQAVSKWENGITYPDVTLIPEIADIFGVSIDTLYSRANLEPATRLVEEKDKKKIEDMIFRIVVDSGEGDHVRVNLPFVLMKSLIEASQDDEFLMEVGGVKMSSLKDVRWDSILHMVEKGVIGELVEVESADGDKVHIFVE